VTSTTLNGFKEAVDFAAPKHVTEREIVGFWRLDQSVGKAPDGPFTSCVANVELNGKGGVKTVYEGEIMLSEYTFTERAWPRSCKIEFQAKAFQGPSDEYPVNMLYKGYFRRKVLDNKIIRIEGKIYALSGKGMFKRQVPIGTFTARKRIAPPVRRREPPVRENAVDDNEEYDLDDYYDDAYYDDDNEPR